MLRVEDIIAVKKAEARSGYEIVFPDNKIIFRPVLTMRNMYAYTLEVRDGRDEVLDFIL